MGATMELGEIGLERGCDAYTPADKDGINEELNGLDFGIIVGYFALVICTGLGVTLYGHWQRKKAGEAQGAGDFFLASRSMYFIPVAASLFFSYWDGFFFQSMFRREFLPCLSTSESALVANE